MAWTVFCFAAETKELGAKELLQICANYEAQLRLTLTAAKNSENETARQLSTEQSRLTSKRDAVSRVMCEIERVVVLRDRGRERAAARLMQSLYDGASTSDVSGVCTLAARWRSLNPNDSPTQMAASYQTELLAAIDKNTKPILECRLLSDITPIPVAGPAHSAFDKRSFRQLASASAAAR